jgi:hypothetical protein
MIESKKGISEIIAESMPMYVKQYRLTGQQRKAVWAIENCRSEKLGSHLLKCDECGYEQVHYNSCRNRHCPQCQGKKQEQWVAKLKEQLLPCRYFHVVFTIPDKFLNEIIYSNQTVMYDILLKSSSQALQKVSMNPEFLGAKTGAVAVLHTWGQNMLFHPHVHMLVPAGGLSEDKWEWVKTGKKFFVPTKALSKVFRGIFVRLLKEACQTKQVKGVEDFDSLKNNLYLKPWNVYCKKTFGGPGQVISYLGRYTHKIAISNNRILSTKAGKVRFKWKDYREKRYLWKEMELDSLEFVRRYLLHVLPSNFYKIRYYGLFSVAVRRTDLAQSFNLLGVVQTVSFNNNAVKGICSCPVCRLGKMTFLPETVMRE